MIHDPTANPDQADAPAPRVLLLSPVGEIGGGERVMLDLIRFARTRVRFAVACLADGPLVAAARDAGAERVTVCPLPPAGQRAGDSALTVAAAATTIVRLAAAVPGIGGTIDAINRSIADFHPDVVHSNGLKTHLLSPWLARRGGRSKLVWHVHDFLGGRAIARHLLPAASGGVHAIAGVSRAVARDAADVLGDRSPPIVTIYNGVDLDRFSPGPGDPASLDDPAAPTGLVRVGLVATYARWKGQDVFIDAVSRLPATVRAMAWFYIVGGPIYRTAGSQWSQAELEHRISGAGLQDEIRLTGPAADVPSVYRALDVVVHASTRPEPFGLTIVESMACGRATVVARAGGAVELFREGRSALSAPPGDASALAGQLARLIGDPRLRENLGRSGREQAARHFGIHRFADEWVRLYRQVTQFAG